ncbi:hypothetical protein Emed_003831 [Eimeria media]
MSENFTSRHKRQQTSYTPWLASDSKTASSRGNAAAAAAAQQQQQQRQHREQLQPKLKHSAPPNSTTSVCLCSSRNCSTYCGLTNILFSLVVLDCVYECSFPPVHQQQQQQVQQRQQGVWQQLLQAACRRRDLKLEAMTMLKVSAMAVFGVYGAPATTAAATQQQQQQQQLSSSSSKGRNAYNRLYDSNGNFLLHALQQQQRYLERHGGPQGGQPLGRRCMQLQGETVPAAIAALLTTQTLTFYPGRPSGLHLQVAQSLKGLGLSFKQETHTSSTFFSKAAPRDNQAVDKGGGLVVYLQHKQQRRQQQQQEGEEAAGSERHRFVACQEGIAPLFAQRAAETQSGFLSMLQQQQPDTGQRHQQAAVAVGLGFDAAAPAAPAAPMRLMQRPLQEPRQQQIALIATGAAASCFRFVSDLRAAENSTRHSKMLK